MGQILSELGAALGVLLTSLGTRSGLWAALADAGPLTDREVAAKVRVHPSLVREWLRAQAAAGYLYYDACRRDIHPPGARRGRDPLRPRRCLGRRVRDHAVVDGRGIRRLQRGVRDREGIRLASAHRRPLARCGRLHQGRAPWRAHRRLDRGDACRRRGAGRRRHGRRCRLRLRHPHHDDREPVPRGEGARHRLPRRIRRARPRAGGTGQRPVRGGRGGRPTRYGLRPDHLLRLAARHRRSARRLEPGQICGGRLRNRPVVRAAGRRRRPGQPDPDRPDVLLDLDSRLYAERGVAGDHHVIGGSRCPSRRARGSGRSQPRRASLASAGSTYRRR